MTRKQRLANLENCQNRLVGMKVNQLYLLVLTSLSKNPSCCSLLALFTMKLCAYVPVSFAQWPPSPPPSDEFESYSYCPRSAVARLGKSWPTANDVLRPRGDGIIPPCSPDALTNGSNSCFFSVKFKRELCFLGSCDEFIFLALMIYFSIY